MPKFSANLSFLYADLPFLDRFAAAADGRLSGGRVRRAPTSIRPRRSPRRWPDQRPDAGALQPAARRLGRRRARHRLPARPGRRVPRRGRHRDPLRQGARLPEDQLPRRHRARRRRSGRRSSATLVANLQYAAPRLADAGIKLLLEPINLRDIPGFFVSTTAPRRAHPRRGRLGQPLHPVRHLPHAGDAG